MGFLRKQKLASLCRGPPVLLLQGGPTPLRWSFTLGACPLRRTTQILYIAVDDLLPLHGKATAGFDEFSASLEHYGIPAVWLTNRTRFQIDEPRRKIAHTHPFIAEDGCGVYLPEDYFHLKPQAAGTLPKNKPTIRLGRFTCLPVAAPEPAATEALEAVSEETGIEVVSLRGMAPRELARNLGLSTRDAELARQHDFEELFFFVGSNESDIERFRASAAQHKCQLRARENIWSLTAGANLRSCIRELSGLYDRALHAHARSVAVATQGQEAAAFAACDKAILLRTNRRSPSSEHEEAQVSRPGRVIELPLHSSNVWEELLDAIQRAR